MDGLLPNQQRETWPSPFLLPQDLPLHTLLPLQRPLPPHPCKTSSLCPYATPISLGDRPGALPKQTATGSALLAAEPVTPKVTPQAKRVRLPPGKPRLGHWRQLVSLSTAPAIFHAPRQGLQLVILPCIAIASGLVSDALNLSWLLFLSRVSKGGKKEQD